MDYAILRQHVAQARRQHGARQRDVATELGLSEGELVAAHVGAAAPAALHATVLHADWPALFAELAMLGNVLALTRNDDCVHEKLGVYRPFSHDGATGLVLGEAIDLRLFFTAWAHGYAVEDTGCGAPQQSLQFYDRYGDAVHKIFRQTSTDAAGWNDLVARFTHASQAPGLAPQRRPLAEAERPDAQVDVAGLCHAWASLRDTHDFFALLKRFGVSRRQALRLAEPRFASALAPNAITLLLSEAARRGVPIMVFTGNPGTIQIHSGPVKRVFVQGAWINVMDEGFNLHLRQDRVTDAWLVRKPTRDGLVSSLELFNAEGKTVAMLFGVRKPGVREREDWRALLAWLQEEAEPCQA